MEIVSGLVVCIAIGLCIVLVKLSQEPGGVDSPPIEWWGLPREPAPRGSSGDMGQDQADAAFAKLLDEMAETLDGDWFPSKLTGVGHDNDDGSSRQERIQRLEVMENLILIPEPECVDDIFAIRAEDGQSKQVGYLQRRVAEEVCRSLKEGVDWGCVVWEVTGRGKGILGVNIALIRWKYRYGQPRNTVLR